MDLQTVTVLITGISVIIAAANSIVSSRRAEEQRRLTLETQQQALETRQAQLFMQVYNRWNSRDFTKSYGALRYKFTEQDWLETLNIVFNSPNHKNPDLDLDDYADHQMLGTFFEGLGILVKKGLIDVELVDDLLSQRIIWYWETQVQPIEDMARASLGDLALYDSIDYLYEKMKNRHQSTAVST